MSADVCKVADVAKMFRVSTKTVVRWCDAGQLAYFLTLGGHRRFDRAAMEARAAEQGFSAVGKSATMAVPTNRESNGD